MKTVCLFIYGWLPCFLFGQNITMQLTTGVKKLEADEQFKHALISMYVVDNKTGKIVFDKNSSIGLAPASCQKIITSVTSSELLGNDYHYKTYLTHDQPITNGILKGNLYIVGGGDPTLGSPRWKASSEEMVLKKIAACLQKNNIQSIAGGIIADDHLFSMDAIPRGWVWEDIGNYYGAGVWGLNWRENQFDVTFKTGNAANDSTTIIATQPEDILSTWSFTNFVKTGEKGSGDNGYLFSAPFAKNIIAKGTVPPTLKGFTISGSTPNPPNLFLQTVDAYLKNNGISVQGKNWSYTEHLLNNQTVSIPNGILMDSIVSPSLDSVNYWFLKKSVNLFGEALIKTIAAIKYGDGTTDKGVNIIKDFWSKRGIDPSSLNIVDGSGLSPANRVTASALVTILNYARRQKWYPSFYKALPVRL